MINAKARRYLLLQQQLRILRRQQAVASAPGYFEHMAATLRTKHFYRASALRLLLRRGMAWDPYNTADQL